MEERKDDNISAMGTVSIGEAGKTGDWRSLRPVIDRKKCIPMVKNKPACYLCWLYCPEGVIRAGVEVTIDLDYCKGCGICAEECPPRAISMIREDRSHE